MPHKPEDFTLYDILIEAESCFGKEAATYRGYSDGDYWQAIYEATKARREAERQYQPRRGGTSGS